MLALIVSRHAARAHAYHSSRAPTSVVTAAAAPAPSCPLVRHSPPPASPPAAAALPLGQTGQQTFIRAQGFLRGPWTRSRVRIPTTARRQPQVESLLARKFTWAWGRRAGIRGFCDSCLQRPLDDKFDPVTGSAAPLHRLPRDFLQLGLPALVT